MIETESIEFVIAIAFTTGVIMLVVGMFAFNLIVSAKRLRKLQRLATAAIESTPAFMTIVFDERDQVADLKIQNLAAETHFRAAFIHKKKQELSFLPIQLLNFIKAGDSHIAPESGKATAPLKMPDGNILYLAWEMQDFTNAAGKTEFRIARGYDMTAELLQKQKKLQELSATASEREERERKRIAEDLHDRLGEILVTSSRLLGELKKKSSAPDVSRGLDALDETIQKFKLEIRSLIFDLVPKVLYDVGFVAALETLAENFKKQDKILVRLDGVWQDFPISQEMAVFLYKAVKEFIRNAVKHGGADEILVSLLRTDHTIAVTVQDNGSGFAPDSNPLAPGAATGFGLFNVKTRAEYYRGNVEIADSSTLGGGKITVWVKP